ncbi:MAG: nucleotidyltransferase family protein [Opitutae bacterium]
MTEPIRCGLILLAAGASRRMGRPKQLLPLGGQPLLRHVVTALLSAPVNPFVVVLGSQAAEIAPVLAGMPVEIVVNPEWTEGLGSSLRTGVIALERLAPQLDGLIVALADQPGLTAAHLAALLHRHRDTGRSIVASSVADRAMPPAFFSARWFPRLSTLTGDQGARALLMAQAAEVAHVPLADGTDLDTPEDYQRFTDQRPP